MADRDYAGDITPTDAWAVLAQDQRAVLIDVRTPAEWAYVGVPDLTQLGKQPVFIPWVMFPKMDRNPDFAAQIEQVIPDRDAPLLFICRSGARSRSAAVAMTRLGYSACFNVDTGFEGGHDPLRHRGTVNGWKAAQLPWVQG